MAISGNLEDVSVADVMQFIHLGRRTGALLLRHDGEQAMIGFHRGKLVSAGSPRTPRLGELLVRSDLLSREELDRAVETQESEPERRSLGQILVAQGSIGPESLRQVVGQQIEQTISELVGWDRGTFEFVVDDSRPIDDIALYPGDVVPDADINTQMVLLEAARIFDERNRDAPASPDDTHATGPVHGGGGGGILSPAGDLDVGRAATASVVAEAEAPADLGWATPAILEEIGVHRLQIVTSDAGLIEALDHALPPGFASVEPVGQRAAGKAYPGHEAPIVLLDLRGDGVQIDELARLRRTRPGTPLVALVDPDAAIGKIYEAGALATLPPEVDAIISCVENLARNRRRSALHPSLGGEPDVPESPGVERLRRVFGDLRSGLISATVALNLMHIISESVERAILFLVKRDGLTALGAFGAASDGRPLADRARGMTLTLRDDNALTQSYQRSEVVTTEFSEAGLPANLSSALGPPANGRIVVFPVLGAQRVISVIYTDNGENESPIEDIDILELATAQVGMAFENELLRRQINQQT